MIEHRVEFLTGEMEVKPVEFRITSTVEGPWWRRQIRWWVETDYARFGSFDSKREAENALRSIRGTDNGGVS